jgi:Ca2+-binding RTX toxin-like protein
MNLVTGSEGDDVLTGTDGNDVIYGGAGDDVLTGGLGDDIFLWRSGDEGTADSPAIDTITDFSMNNLAGWGNDQLDLRDLISSADRESLDDYMTIKQEGDNAVLEIRTDGNPSSGATQVIVLENVYSSHSDGGSNDADAVNELIKQAIILNS